MQQTEHTQKKLLIIDGYGFIFRAYHVLPPFTSPAGKPAGAIYGFTSMLFKVLNDFKPTYAAIVLDSGGKNFRHTIYDKYKAHRPTPPQDLIDQLPHTRAVAKALNLKVLEKEGVEADDIIATLKTKAANINAHVTIISSDKDLMQLIDSNTAMFDSLKNKYITDEDVAKKFGVGPKYLREVLALMGDSSDNIPGVPSIGPKTASELIKQFGSVDNLLQSIDQVKSARLQQVLKDSRDLAFISWQLVGLDYNIEGLNYDFETFFWTPPSQEIISEFLTQYNFKSLYKRAENLFGGAISGQNANVEEYETTTNIETIKTLSRFEELLKIAENKGVASLYLVRIKDKPVAFILSIEKNAYIIEIEEDNLSLFGHHNQNFFSGNFIDFCNNHAIKKITYDIKKFFRFFHYIKNFKAFDDLALMEYALAAGSPNKESSEILQIEMCARFVIEFHKKYEQLISTLLVNNALSLYRDIDLPLCYVLNKMERCGVKIDVNQLKELSLEFASEIDDLERDIYSAVGIKFNIASPKQLGEVLFEKMQLPLGKLSSKTKSYSTNAEVLEKLSEAGYHVADLLLRWRQLTKLKSTYTDALIDYVNPHTKRIHTTFLQNVTTTGRLSSQDPNLQNIPIRSSEGNKIRAAFVADEGYKLISADYSQIELRILSHIADVKVLKEAFTHGEDIHSKTACNIFQIQQDQLTQDHRRKAKAINFGIIYGISPFGLAKQLNISTSIAGEYIKKYFEEYPEIKEYMEKTKLFAKEHGYVQNLFGRKCFVPNINAKNNTLRQFSERSAINAPIQGTNADIIKLAMIKFNNKSEEIGLSTRMILQIHDELLFEAPEAELDVVLPIIKTIMENCASLDVPLVVDAKIGNNWKDTKE